jgi:TIP41-like family
MSRKAVFASDDILSHFQCKKNSSTASNEDTASRDSSESLSLNGWTFRSLHGMMLDSKGLCHIAAEISRTVGGTLSSEDHINVSDRILRLPCMIFGNDALSAEFNAENAVVSTAGNGESKGLIKGGESLVISIDAVDALSCWAAQHTLSSQSTTPLKILQVPCAKTWKELAVISSNDTEKKTNSAMDLEASIASGNRNIWDWTFTSDYCCTVATVNNDFSLSQQSGGAISATATASGDLSGVGSNPVSLIIAGRDLSGGLPFITKHADSTSSSSSSAAAAAAAAAVAADAVAAVSVSSSAIMSAPTPTRNAGKWVRSDVSGIDYNLLRMQNIPILLFDEILLYQDDLEDCGDVIFDAKLRVMPICWFILSRFFVRVDGVIVRIRDTRIFHRFGENKVHMEITWREADLAENSSKGSAECSLSNAILTNPAACAERLPIVNDVENVHRFYALSLI